jgi:pyruvate,water dikinase
MSVRLADESKRLRRDWKRRWEPRIRRVKAFITKTDCDSMSTPELTAHLDRCLTRAAHGFQATMESAQRMFPAVEPYYAFVEEALGPEGIGLAGASIQGFTNESSASETALHHLALEARRLQIESLVRTAALDKLPGALAGSVKGQGFLRSLDLYLDHYGWRTPTWFELSNPSWRDDPSEPLRLVQSYLAEDAVDPRPLLGRSARRRREAIREIRSRLPEGKRARFDELWQTARQFVPVSEGRAMWQLSLGGFLRVPALALGARLVDAGDLDRAGDIFYLSMSELAGEPGAGGWRDAVKARRAEREHYMRIVPPMTLGIMRPPPAPAEGGPPPPMALPAGARLVSGFGGERSTDDRILKGHAASPGTAHGVARVVETVDQAGKVEQGDILVCRFTTPAWSHLFSRVGAIVADSGGVLSHCAILAREYAIPCVPGVRVGTRRIRDGMRLTVDGSQGIVRIED